MNAIRREAGFTLIELLVVIGILSMLMVVLLPQVFEGDEAAKRLGAKKNMEAIWTWHRGYADDHSGQVKAKTGHEFVLFPWVEKRCQRTQQNFSRFWVPKVSDARRQELEEQGQLESWDDIWRTESDITTEDTHFAGPARALSSLSDGKLPMLATDNENGAIFKDGSVLIMMADKSIVELNADILREKYGFTGEGDEALDGFPVGSESPDEMLQRLKF